MNGPADHQVRLTALSLFAATCTQNETTWGLEVCARPAMPWRKLVPVVRTYCVESCDSLFPALVDRAIS
jgi:hypothetical protein